MKESDIIGVSPTLARPLHMCVCLCVCVHACVRAHMRVCVYTYMLVCLWPYTVYWQLTSGLCCCGPSTAAAQTQYMVRFYTHGLVLLIVVVTCTIGTSVHSLGTRADKNRRLE